MNKNKLFASTRTNGSAKSGLARLGAAFVVLIGIVLLVVSGCAGDVTVPVPVPTPTPTPDPTAAPTLSVSVQISVSTAAQGDDVTLSATVKNTGDAPSTGNAILAFYRSIDPVITPDLVGAGLPSNILPDVLTTMEEGMNTPLGLDPIFTADVLEQLAANRNVADSSSEGVIIAGVGLDPIVGTEIVGPLADGGSDTKTISIPSTIDVGTFYYGACIVLNAFHCNSTALVVTVNAIPDLRPVSGPILNQKAYQPNDIVTISAGVYNTGGAANTDGQVRFFREAGDADVEVGTATLPAIPTGVGNSTTVETTFRAAGPFGTQQYYFVISGVTDELNVFNNRSDLSGFIIVFGGNTIDADGDNLIDILNLNMLNNIHYNPAGTSYKTSWSDLGMQCGDDGGTPCQGYELMRDLDFNQAKSYALDTINTDWQPNNPNPDQATNSGWRPIFDFKAIFEGNEYSISNLYARYIDGIGLFASNYGTIRNIAVINGNVYGYNELTDSWRVGYSRDRTIGRDGISGNDLVGIIAGFNGGTIINAAARGGSATGAGSSAAIGALVGENKGTIAASYATANATGWSLVGAFAGRNHGTIVASYATGTAVNPPVRGRASIVPGGNLFIGSIAGGFVGRNHSAVKAVYSTGSAVGTARNNDATGGLIGDNTRSASISATYSTANTNGLTSEHNYDSTKRCFHISTGIWFMIRHGIGVWECDFVGSLVGRDFHKGTENSYAFGTVRGREAWYTFSDGNPKPNGVTHPSQLTATTVPSWNAVDGASGAWVLNSAYSAPVLKYADYDGPGGIDYCAQLPTGACSGNRLLPNQQHFLDQGGSIGAAYVVGTDISSTTGFSMPAKLTIGDVDYFQITVVEAGTLVIESTGEPNSQVMLQTSSGADIEYNDNGGSGNNFKISRAVARGIYYIRAYGYSNQAGPYMLNVSLQ